MMTSTQGISFLLLMCSQLLLLASAENSSMQKLGCLSSADIYKRITLNCPSGTYIKVTKARYGVSALGVCSPSMRDCTQAASVPSHCCHRQRCLVDIQNIILKSCSSWAGYYQVSYECKPAEYINCTAKGTNDKEGENTQGIQSLDNVHQVTPKDKVPSHASKNSSSLKSFDHLSVDMKRQFNTSFHMNNETVHGLYEKLAKFLMINSNLTEDEIPKTIFNISIMANLTSLWNFPGTASPSVHGDFDYDYDEIDRMETVKYEETTASDTTVLDGLEQTTVGSLWSFLKPHRKPASNEVDNVSVTTTKPTPSSSSMRPINTTQKYQNQYSSKSKNPYQENISNRTKQHSNGSLEFHDDPVKNVPREGSKADPIVVQPYPPSHTDAAMWHIMYTKSPVDVGRHQEEIPLEFQSSDQALSRRRLRTHPVRPPGGRFLNTKSHNYMQDGSMSSYNDGLLWEMLAEKSLSLDPTHKRDASTFQSETEHTPTIDEEQESNAYKTAKDSEKTHVPRLDENKRQENADRLTEPGPATKMDEKIDPYHSDGFVPYDERDDSKLDSDLKTLNTDDIAAGFNPYVKENTPKNRQKTSQGVSHDSSQDNDLDKNNGNHQPISGSDYRQPLPKNRYKFRVEWEPFQPYKDTDANLPSNNDNQPNANTHDRVRKRWPQQMPPTTHLPTEYASIRSDSYQADPKPTGHIDQTVRQNNNLERLLVTPLNPKPTLYRSEDSGHNDYNTVMAVQTADGRRGAVRPYATEPNTPKTYNKSQAQILSTYERVPSIEKKPSVPDFLTPSHTTKLAGPPWYGQLPDYTTRKVEEGHMDKNQDIWSTPVAESSLSLGNLLAIVSGEAALFITLLIILAACLRRSSTKYSSSKTPSQVYLSYDYDDSGSNMTYITSVGTSAYSPDRMPDHKPVTHNTGTQYSSAAQYKSGAQYDMYRCDIQKPVQYATPQKCPSNGKHNSAPANERPAIIKAPREPPPPPPRLDRLSTAACAAPQCPSAASSQSQPTRRYFYEEACTAFNIPANSLANKSNTEQPHGCQPVTNSHARTDNLIPEDGVSDDTPSNFSIDSFETTSYSNESEVPVIDYRLREFAENELQLLDEQIAVLFQGSDGFTKRLSCSSYNC